MTLESLLLSSDPQVIRVLRLTLEKLSIEVQVCQASTPGTEMLFAEKYDAVIVDCDDLQGGVAVLNEVRKSPSNRSSIAFAILNGTTTTQKAFEMGANFVLQKPITPLTAMRCLNAALGLMVRERRRYFRHPVETPVHLTSPQGGEIKVTTLNISEGGMAVLCSDRLSVGPVAKIRFNLQGLPGTLEPRGEIVWVDGQGRAGVRFLEMPTSTRESLERWLEAQLKPVN